MKKVLGIVLCLCLLSGCGTKTAVPTEPAASDRVAAPVEVTELFSDRDYDASYEKYATITLKGTAASTDANGVQISGTTITITKEGSYRIQGKLDDGQIIVNTDKKDKTQLILDGATIHSETSAPIYILQADKVFVTLVGENTLSNGGSFAADDTGIDAVLFSKEDLTLNGKGTLTISSPTGHGIVSKDELTVTGGSYTLTTGSHGIAGKDNVCIDGGSFSIAAGKDGIHSENNDDATLGFVYIKSGDFSISAEGDGISGGSWVQLEGGTYDILTGGGWENGQKQSSDNWGAMGGGMGPGGYPGGGFPGGGGGKPSGRPGGNGNGGQVTNMAYGQTTTEESTSIKGIKAGTDLVINGGNFTMDSADDTLHANGNLTVTGGSFQLSTGDDGLHGENTLLVTGGTIVISESYEGLEAQHVKISGGDIALKATDDGLNAAGGTDQSGMGGRDQYGRPGGFGGASNGSILISGGEVRITAYGDGIDANGTLEITGGHTTVCGPTQGDTSTLDYDVSGIITGGTFIGSGGTMMAHSFSQASQGVIAVRVNGNDGTQITLTDSNGKVLVDHTPELGFALVILSTPEMVKGQTYTLTVGNTTNSITAN